MRSRARVYRTVGLTMVFFTLIFYVFSSSAVKDWYAGWYIKDVQEQICSLRYEIGELKIMRELYLGRAKEHEEKSARLDNSLFSRRHKKLALQNQKMAKSIDKDIATLKNRTERILKKQPAAQEDDQLSSN